MKKYVLLLIMLVCVSAVFASGAEEKQKVKYGDLDICYTDLDGDMIADVPADERDQLDPDTLVFAYAPVEDPAVYEEVFVDFIDHLEDVTGKNVKWFAVTSYATQIEAMRAGRLHVSGFAAGSVEDAVNTGGFVPLSLMGSNEGIVGYKMAIITNKSTGYKTAEDIKGHEVAFVSESSNSGYAAPRAILYSEFNYLPGQDYETVFSGSHDNSIMGVYNEDYEIAAIADTVLERMVAGDRVPNTDDWLQILYSSNTFPPTAWGVTNKLNPELQAKIKEAFLTYDWEGTKMKETWPEDDRFIELDYANDYKVLRSIKAGSAKVAELLGE